MKRRLGARKRLKRAIPPTIAKRYRLCKCVVQAIRRAAPLYGSQGRALQVATELLIRTRKPIRVPAGRPPVVGMTYKLVPRTADLIDQLADRYGSRGTVFAACARVLKMKV